MTPVVNILRLFLFLFILCLSWAEVYSESAGLNEDELDKLAQDESNFNFNGKLGASLQRSFASDHDNLDPHNIFLDDPSEIYQTLFSTQITLRPLSVRGLQVNFDNYVNLYYDSKDSINNVHYRDIENYVTELHVRQGFETVNLFLGRKNILEGTAYFVNPTNYLGKNSGLSGLNRDQKAIIETRMGEILVGVEKLWNDTSLLLLYIPEISNSSNIEIETNEDHQFMSRFSRCLIPC